MQRPVLALILLDVLERHHLTPHLFKTMSSLGFQVTPFSLFPSYLTGCSISLSCFPSILTSWCGHARGLSLWSSSLSAFGSLVMSSSLMALNTIYMLMSTSICSPDLSSKLQLHRTSHFHLSACMSKTHLKLMSKTKPPISLSPSCFICSLHHLSWWLCPSSC